MNDTPMLKSANEFSLYIEKAAAQAKITYVEAVLQFCQEHMLDPSEVASKINKSLREKIAQDFRDLNYLPKTAQLEL